MHQRLVRIHPHYQYFCWILLLDGFCKIPKIVCVVVSSSSLGGLKIVVLETTKSPVLFSFVWANIDIGKGDTANSQIRGERMMTNLTIPAYNEILSVLLVFKFSVDGLCFHKFISTNKLSWTGNFLVVGLNFLYSAC